MKLNQRGGTLVTVLLVILVFSVLGFAVMGSVIGENKRTKTTESNMQARYLAESGLTYFEKDFKTTFKTEFEKYLRDNQSNLSSINLINKFNQIRADFLLKYQNEVPIREGRNGNEVIKVKALMDGENLKVISTGKIDSSKEILNSFYKPSIFMDINQKTYELADFTKEGLGIDFTDIGVAKINLLNLISLGLIEPKGEDRNFYTVPYDTLLKVGVLGPVLGLDLSGNKFKTMEDNRVIATRKGGLLNLGVLQGNKGALLSVNLLNYQSENDTNVLIDGGFKTLQLIGLDLFPGFENIDFKKLAVLGNVVIKQDKWGVILLDPEDYSSSRRFTFNEGLYVNKSLTIGSRESKEVGIINKRTEYEPKSNLILGGNMVAMKNLNIKDVNLTIGDGTKEEAIYVHGDAIIKNACVNNGKQNDNYDFRVIAKGKITFVENPDNTACNTFKGLFYSEQGIQFDTTNNRKITINGGLVGNIINRPNLIYNPHLPLLEDVFFKGTKLEPKGRTFQK